MAVIESKIVSPLPCTPSEHTLYVHLCSSTRGSHSQKNRESLLFTWVRRARGTIQQFVNYSSENNYIPGCTTSQEMVSVSWKTFLHYWLTPDKEKRRRSEEATLGLCLPQGDFLLCGQIKATLHLSNPSLNPFRSENTLTEIDFFFLPLYQAKMRNSSNTTEIETEWIWQVD